MVEQVGDRLRAQGDRMTRPRAAVLTVLAEVPGHLRIEEIAEAAARSDPAVHRSTVYRALDRLCDLGVVQHIHLGHGATAYHLTDDVAAHPHAQCRRCGRVQDLPVDLLAVVSARLADVDDFVLDDTHVALSGLCGECVRG